LAPPFTAIARLWKRASKQYWLSELKSFLVKIRRIRESRPPMLAEVGCRYVSTAFGSGRHFFRETAHVAKKRSGACGGPHPDRLRRRTAGTSRSRTDRRDFARRHYWWTGCLTPDEVSPSSYSWLVFIRASLGYWHWARRQRRKLPARGATASPKWARRDSSTAEQAPLRIAGTAAAQTRQHPGLMAQEELDGALVGGASLTRVFFRV